MSNVETLQGLERQVTLTLSKQEIEQAVVSELKRVQKTAKVQGFRPGKAPLKLLEQSHGPSIRGDVIYKQVGKAFEAAVYGIKVAGAPSIEAGQDSDTELSFVAKFEVFPEIPAVDYAALEVTRYTAEVTDEDLENTIDVLRRQRATYESDAARQAQDGDRVTLDFVGTIDGVEFAGGKAQDFVFLLGNGQMLPEFEAATKGLKAGEEKTFELTFPENYGGKAVAGKTAEFKITVKEVAQAVLPELTPDFVKTLGQDNGDLAQFKEEVRKNLQRELKKRVGDRNKQGIFEKLVESVEFELPKALIRQDVDDRIAAARHDLKARGVPNADTLELPANLFEGEAQRRVKLGLLFTDIVGKEKLQAKPDQVRALIEELALNYEKPEEVVTYYLGDAQRRQEMEALAVEQNVVDFIFDKAKVTEEQLAFKDLMGNV